MQSADKRYILQRNTVQTETGFISLHRPVKVNRTPIIYKVYRIFSNRLIKHI